MKRCTRCKREKGLDQFNLRTSSRDGRQYHCRACVSVVERRRKRAPKPLIPMHLQHLIQRRGGRWVCIPGDTMREVLELIKPGLTPEEVAAEMRCDWHNADRLFKEDWVSEMKVDRILTAFHVPHLWLESPLNEYRLALLEYEELVVGALPEEWAA